LYDIILLQEHWLFPFELDYLSNISEDFFAYGKSAINLNVNVCKGRPYGGTAILFRKNFLPFVTSVQSDNPRITAMILNVILNNALTSILFTSVYMPVDDISNDEDFEFICGELNAMIVDSNVNHFIFAGDFNFRLLSNRHTFIQSELKGFNVVFADQLCLPNNSFTYVSDVHGTTSWIDHVLVNRQLLQSITNMFITYDCIASDHKPVSAKLSASLPSTPDVPTHTDNPDLLSLPNWSACTPLQLSQYTADLEQLLQSIPIPNLCTAGCSSEQCTHVIDIYYYSVTDCINIAMQRNIPTKTCSSSHYCVTGWNESVEDRHVAARCAFTDWVAEGKPRFGYTFEMMKRTRAKFKLALRYCKMNEEMIKCDAMAREFLARSGDFWKKVKKYSNSKMTKFANSVNGVVGDEAIADMWKQAFESLYNLTTPYIATSTIEAAEAVVSDSNIIHRLSITDVCKAVNKVKSRKACGPDGIPSEAIKYGGNALIVHISILFDMFLAHSYLPTKLICTTLVPLLKNKSGDLSDVNNYRAIALSNSISKLFEDVLLDCLQQYDSDNDDCQFGFKREHSTTMGCHVLKRAIDYYRCNGSYVFSCFLNLTKAFDRVNHNLLFNKLIKLNFPVNIIKLLIYWYANQQVNVRWKNCITQCFQMSNGTRQGSVLSPYLFGIYMRDVSVATTTSGVGCYIGSEACNILLYADDIVLLSPSWRSLQKLIDICVFVTAKLNMIFNVKKSVSMIFAPYNVKNRVDYDFPMFKISDRPLEMVTVFKYLGTLISDDLSDDHDITRQMGLLYARTNFLIRKFYNCSRSVKLCLFKAYCLNFYGIALWDKSHKSVMNKLESAYVKCIKMFFGFVRLHSVTDMFLQLRLPTFKTLLHNAKVKFDDRCTGHSNRLLSTVQLICT
jgi:endonuclease/exonuclease/phosphatase family metal-dependent hydrolase